MRIRVAIAIDDGEGTCSAFGLYPVADDCDLKDQAAKDLAETGFGADRVLMATIEVPDPVELVGEVEK